MSKPQFIIGVKNNTLVDKIGLAEGLNPVDIMTIAGEMQEGIVIGQREALESDESVRQVLPYVILSQFDSSVGLMKYITYRRTKKVGESRLAGNVSVGWGGHIDLVDVQHQDSVIDLIGTIGVAVNREITEEVLFLNPEAASGDMVDLSLLSVGILLDNSNDVGKVHMGVIINGQLPEGTIVQCAEEELEIMTPMTASELLNSGLPLENWTRISIEYLESLENGA